MEALPNEVLLKICNLLSPRDVFGELKFVSRRLYSFIDSAEDRFTHPRIPICYLNSRRVFHYNEQGELVDTRAHFKTPTFDEEFARSRIGTLIIEGSIKEDSNGQKELLSTIHAERVLFNWSRHEEPLEDLVFSHFESYAGFNCSPIFYPQEPQWMTPSSSCHFECGGASMKRPRLTEPAPKWATWVFEHLRPPKQFGLLRRRAKQIEYFLLPTNHSIRFSELPIKETRLATDPLVIPLNIGTISEAASFFERLESDALIHGQWTFNVHFDTTAPALDFQQCLKKFKEYGATSMELRDLPTTSNENTSIMRPIEEMQTAEIRFQIRPRRQRIDETVHQFIEKISKRL